MTYLIPRTRGPFALARLGAYSTRSRSTSSAGAAATNVCTVNATCFARRADTPPPTCHQPHNSQRYVARSRPRHDDRAAATRSAFRGVPRRAFRRHDDSTVVMHVGHNTRWNDPADTCRCQHAGHMPRRPTSAIRAIAAADADCPFRAAVLTRSRCFFARLRSWPLHVAEQYAGISGDAPPARVAGTGAVNHTPHCGRRHRPATSTLARRRGGFAELPQSSEQNRLTRAGGHDVPGLTSRRIAYSIDFQIVNGVPHRVQRQAMNIFGPRRPGTYRSFSPIGSRARHTCTAVPVTACAGVR